MARRPRALRALEDRHERLRKWTTDGTWETLLEHAIVKDDSVGAVEWTFSIDSSSIRAHQHAAGARKEGAAARRSKPSPSTGNTSDDPEVG